MTRLKACGCALAALLTGGVCEAGYQGNFTGTFETIQDPYCYSPWSFYGFTVGGQYVDSGNGVVPGTHSMLARWQGDSFVSNTVYYDMGHFNGAHLYNQRGYQPEDATLGSPGVSANCYDFGMLLNTRLTPHRPIVGGGYNDMYGYAWSAGSRPRPFTKNGSPTHLVLQSNVGISTFLPTNPSGAVDPGAGSANVGFYAYLRDTTHPSLPPICVLAMSLVHGFSGTSWGAGGGASFDYTDYDSRVAAQWYPAWLNGASGDGVWFVAGPILANPGNQSSYVSTYYTEGQTTGDVPVGPLDSPPMPFFRAHIRPADWVNTVYAINEATNASNASYYNPNCGNARKCPPNGSSPTGGPGTYSTNPADYELEYAGLIAETTLIQDNFDGLNYKPASNFDASPASWVPNDPTKPQVMLGVHGYGLGIYRGIP